MKPKSKLSDTPKRLAVDSVFWLNINSVIYIPDTRNRKYEVMKALKRKLIGYVGTGNINAVIEFIRDRTQGNDATGVFVFINSDEFADYIKGVIREYVLEN